MTHTMPLLPETPKHKMVLLPHIHPLDDYHQVREELRETLLELSFHAFAQCISQLLSRKGYSSVHLLDRTEWRQFTRHGGIDMEAFGKVGVVGVKVLIQVKQYRRAVHRRFVDELRGVTLRKNAGHALLITTSTFSEPAKAAAYSDGIAPIRLVTGEELLDWLIQERLGVWEEINPEGTLIRGIDCAYFDELQHRYPGEKRKQVR